MSYYCKAQTNRDDNSVYHAGREWSRVRSGKGPRGHRLQKLRPQEGRGGAQTTAPRGEKACDKSEKGKDSVGWKGFKEEVKQRQASH